MKRLELQNFGVVEMNNDEMREMNGGLWAELALIVVAVVATAIYEGAKADGVAIGKRLKANGQTL